VTRRSIGVGWRSEFTEVLDVFIRRWRTNSELLTGSFNDLRQDESVIPVCHYSLNYRNSSIPPQILMRGSVLL
jgi:hypothetical protein